MQPLFKRLPRAPGFQKCWAPVALCKVTLGAVSAQLLCKSAPWRLLPLAAIVTLVLQNRRGPILPCQPMERIPPRGKYMLFSFQRCSSTGTLVSSEALYLPQAQCLPEQCGRALKPPGLALYWLSSLIFGLTFLICTFVLTLVFSDYSYIPFLLKANCLRSVNRHFIYSI